MKENLVKSAHLSFLQMSYVPRSSIKLKHFLDFQNPDAYFDYLVKDKFHKKRVFVKGVGQCRSPLEPKDLTDKDVEWPKLDLFWGNLRRFYDTQPGGKAHFLPYFPAIIDFLPSKQRSYSLDLSQASGTVSSIPKKSSRMSISVYYFPIGLAITRWSIYLQADTFSMTPEDIVSTFRVPDKLRISVYGTGGLVFDDYAVRLVDRLQKKLLLETTGGGESSVIQSTRYSFANLVETSRPVSINSDKDGIFRFVQSPNITTLGQLPQNISYGIPTEGGGMNTGVTVCGERYGFVWGPQDLHPWLEIRYRTFLRNIAMLLMVQKSLTTEVAALQNSGWRDQIKSKTFLSQLRQGTIGPEMRWPLTFMHYLKIQGTFDELSSRRRIYQLMKRSLDNDHVIDRAADDLGIILKGMSEEVKNSASSFFGLVSAAISSVTGKLTSG